MFFGLPKHLFHNAHVLQVVVARPWDGVRQLAIQVFLQAARDNLAVHGSIPP